MGFVALLTVLNETFVKGTFLENRHGLACRLQISHSYCLDALRESQSVVENC